MVSEDESSDDLSSLHISSSSVDMHYQIPASIEDQDYNGLEKAPEVLCVEHRLPTECSVAFESFETGRRFLVCAQPEDENCGFLGWVDSEWPPTMQNALLKLWEMFEDNRTARRKDNLESSLTIHHLKEEKGNLDANYDKLVEDVHQLLSAQEDMVLDFSYVQAKEKRAEVASASAVARMKSETEKKVLGNTKEAENFKLKEKYKVLMNLVEAQGSVIRNLKMNHLKEKEKLTEGNNNLKIQVDELTKDVKKLTEENVQLNLHMSDLKRGHENLIKRRDELKLQLASQFNSLEKSKEKLKLIHDILKE
nr:centromere-associated protein E-like [Aegilops tauschii subsp. strangulata]